jgi:DNA-directed RNA polymerase specialized sigma24 family protein
MPPRRRRTGARPGRLSPGLRAAIATEADNLEASGGPLAVIRAVGDAFAALDAELEVLAQVRLRAVAELRGEGWTYDRIAEATGLSKARVAQLSRAAGVAGRGRHRR